MCSLVSTEYSFVIHDKSCIFSNTTFLFSVLKDQTAYGIAAISGIQPDIKSRTIRLAEYPVHPYKQRLRTSLSRVVDFFCVH